MYVGIDLALRNIGIVKLKDDGSYHSCALVTSSPKKHNDEELLFHNQSAVWGHLVHITDKKYIALEGLSFNSKSASVDLIAANHWGIRCMLYEEAEVTIVPPKSWQSTIFTKEVTDLWKEKYPIIRAKKKMKLTKEEKAANSKSKLEIRKLAKEYILEQVPESIKEQFQKYIKENKFPKDTIYDLADAYSLANYLRLLEK